ncbi:MAG: hypothetical protein JOZ81_08370 [Chloroflexi bacterium]|nr:hypothetical protein [Chloroflexota bacterium]
MSLHDADIQLQRASAAYDAMQRSMSAGRGLYRETAAADSPLAYVWPFSRALLGTLCLARLGVLAPVDCLKGLERYWTGAAYASAVVPPGGDVYYDDNAWIALALVLAHRLDIVRQLDRVRQLYTFGLRAWDRDHGGGILWVQQGVGYGLSNHDRGAGATAGWAEVGLHLQELGGKPEPMPQTLLEWVSTHLDASHAGHGPFLNVVRGDGSIDTNVWSYNQGVMLGARVLQYRLTRDIAYLTAAEGIARQTLGTFGDFERHPPSFNAMCFQNMLMLHAETADAQLQAAMREAMVQYAEWAWDPSTRARDEATNLFYFDDAGRPALGSQPARVQDQGAMTQLYALLAWPRSDYAKLT